MSYFDKRNWKIYFEWIDGKEYKELAVEFGLTANTIKEICHQHLPPTVRGNPWQSAHAYRRYREWKRTHKFVRGGTAETDVKADATPATDRSVN